MEIWENKKGKAERNQNGWGHNASWVIQIAWNWAKCVEMKYFSHGALYFLQIKGFNWNLEILRIIHIFLTCYTIVHMYCATDPYWTLHKTKCEALCSTVSNCAKCNCPNFTILYRKWKVCQQCVPACHTFLLWILHIFAKFVWRIYSRTQFFLFDSI